MNNLSELPAVLKEALESQAYTELSAARIYARLATWAEVNSYPGATKLFWEQSQDEFEHFRKFASFLAKFDHTLGIQPLNEIPAQPTSYPDLFKIALNLELENTTNISRLLDKARELNHGFCILFLQEMLKIQEEEILKFKDYVQQLERIKSDEAGIWHFDRSLL